MYLEKQHYVFSYVSATKRILLTVIYCFPLRRVGARGNDTLQGLIKYANVGHESKAAVLVRYWNGENLSSQFQERVTL